MLKPLRPRTAGRIEQKTVGLVGLLSRFFRQFRKYSTIQLKEHVEANDINLAKL